MTRGQAVEKASNRARGGSRGFFSVKVKVESAKLWRPFGRTLIWGGRGMNWGKENPPINWWAKYVKKQPRPEDGGQVA